MMVSDFEQLSLFPGRTPQPEEQGVKDEGQETKNEVHPPPAARQQWDAWLEDFQAWLGSKNRASRTIRGYTTDLEQFFDFLEERDALDPATLEGQDLVDWLAERRTEGAKGTTLDRKRTALKQFFHWLVEHKGYPYDNPSLALAVPTQDYQLPPTLTASEVAGLLAAPKPEAPQGRRDRAILGLLAGCGLRVGEVVKLRTDHITWGNDPSTGSGHREEPAMLHVSGRLVPLPPNVKRLLEAWLGTADDQIPRNVFDITTRQIRNLVRRYAQAAGLRKHVSPSVLRHTCAVLRLAAGESYDDVKRIMGHELDDIMPLYVERARNLQAIQAAHFDLPEL